MANGNNSQKMYGYAASPMENQTKNFQEPFESKKTLRQLLSTVPKSNESNNTPILINELNQDRYQKRDEHNCPQTVNSTYQEETGTSTNFVRSSISANTLLKTENNSTTSSFAPNSQQKKGPRVVFRLPSVKHFLNMIKQRPVLHKSANLSQQSQIENNQSKSQSIIDRYFHSPPCTANNRNGPTYPASKHQSLDNIKEGIQPNNCYPSLTTNKSQSSEIGSRSYTVSQAQDLYKTSYDVTNVQQPHASPFALSRNRPADTGKNINQASTNSFTVSHADTSQDMVFQNQEHSMTPSNERTFATQPNENPNSLPQSRENIAKPYSITAIKSSNSSPYTTSQRQQSLLATKFVDVKQSSASTYESPDEKAVVTSLGSGANLKQTTYNSILKTQSKITFSPAKSEPGQSSTIVVAPPKTLSSSTKIVFSPLKINKPTTKKYNPRITVKAYPKHDKGNVSQWKMPDASTIQNDFQKTLNMASFRPVSPVCFSVKKPKNIPDIKQEPTDQQLESKAPDKEIKEINVEQEHISNKVFIKKDICETADTTIIKQKRPRGRPSLKNAIVNISRSKSACMRFNTSTRILKTGSLDSLHRLKVLAKSTKWTGALKAPSCFGRGKTDEDDSTKYLNSTGTDNREATVSVISTENNVNVNNSTNKEENDNEAQSQDDIDVLRWLTNLTVDQCMEKQSEVEKREIESAMEFGYNDEALAMLKDKDLLVWQLIDNIGKSEEIL